MDIVGENRGAYRLLRSYCVVSSRFVLGYGLGFIISILRYYKFSREFVEVVDRPDFGKLYVIDKRNMNSKNYIF